MVTVRSIFFFLAIATILISAVAPATGQQADDVAKDIAFLCTGPAVADNNNVLERKEPLLPDDEVSDLRFLSIFMIRAYQTFVSSQQHNVCVFTPSCSHFGMESVRRFGFAKGVLLTADRLTRCNPLVSRGGYAFDRPARKFADPVPADCEDAADTVSCTSSCKRSFP